MVSFNWSWADYEREARKWERETGKVAARPHRRGQGAPDSPPPAPDHQRGEITVVIESLAPPAPRRNASFVPPAPQPPRTSSEEKRAIQIDARNRGARDPFERKLDVPPLPNPKKPPAGGFMAAFDKILQQERDKRKALAEQQAQTQVCDLCGKRRLRPCDDRGCPIL